MKVYISSTGTTLDSNVDPRFGRCAFFIIYNTDSDTFEYYENDSRNAMGGAGIKAAQKALENKIDAVISGSIGPNAFRVFNSSTIKIYTGVSGSIRSAIAQLKNNELTQAASSNVQSHYGIGR